MKKLVLRLLIASGLSGQAFAADVYDDWLQMDDSAGYDSGWEASAFVYGWALSMNGEVGVKPFPRLDYDVTFEEFFDNLKEYFSAFGEVRRGRFGIAADFIFADISDGINVLEEGIFEVRTGGDLGIATLMAEYRLWEQNKSSVDVMAGARLWYFKDDIEVIVGGDTGFTGSEYTWVDPMIGAKMRIQCDCPLYFTGWGMIGGFGASAKLDWDVFGGIGYEVTDHLSIIGGYRAIGIDYEGDELIFDEIMHGPMFGGILQY